MEIWQIDSIPQNLPWIHATVSEKPELTDEWCMTDDGRMHHDVALLRKSSRAKNVPNDLKLTLTFWKLIVPHIQYISTPEAHLLHDQAFSRFQVVENQTNSEMHRMTSKWPWVINSQKHLGYTKHLPPRPKLCSISFYGQPLPRYNMLSKLEKLKMHRMTSDWQWTLNGRKCPLNTAIEYFPPRPKFWSLLLYGQVF